MEDSPSPTKQQCGRHDDTLAAPDLTTCLLLLEVLAACPLPALTAMMAWAASA